MVVIVTEYSLLEGAVLMDSRVRSEGIRDVSISSKARVSSLAKYAYGSQNNRRVVPNPSNIYCRFVF